VLSVNPEAVVLGDPPSRAQSLCLIYAIKDRGIPPQTCPPRTSQADILPPGHLRHGSDKVIYLEVTPALD
jgi:hypothetical protein